MSFIARKRQWTPHPPGPFVAEIGKIEEIDTILDTETGQLYKLNLSEVPEWEVYDR